ncbi:hypothetical protein MMYC01_203345 [Madurella mycetomatis]|uniref:Uncharacterized protein n=1 Tax=Madurella mycetomatis TaxID=100816 RepID=A0A175WAQ0_9PEZI|nr:hypothetical protein MMYC01_203345 [Madurella mycetomatis]
MKFQLLAALFVASAAALPAPEANNHGLIPDVDEWDDAADVEIVAARSSDVSSAAADFEFTPDFSFSLDHLFAEIEAIPDEILEEGDEALHQWLVANGNRPDDANLKRDVDESDDGDFEDLSILERGTLVARASAWKIAQCIAAIVEVIATTAVPAAKLLRIKKYIKALGGTKNAVKLLLSATSTEEKLRVGGQALVKLAKEVLGISSIQSKCF